MILVRADQFTVGQRVRYSQHAYDSNLVKRGTKRPTTGIVRGYGRSPFSLRVQRDGMKTVQTYSAAFWEAFR